MTELAFKRMTQADITEINQIKDIKQKLTYSLRHGFLKHIRILEVLFTITSTEMHFKCVNRQTVIYSYKWNTTKQ